MSRFLSPAEKEFRHQAKRGIERKFVTEKIQASCESRISRKPGVAGAECNEGENYSRVKVGEMWGIPEMG